jgi:endonuclease/exonuclease/phosphatase (EEP) superfamily protein YafD
VRVRGVLGWLLLVVVLAPGVVLTCVRALEPSAGAAVRLESFTPLALLSYGAAFLALLVRALVARSRALVVGAVLVAVGLGAHVWWFAPMVSGANPPASADAEPLRVMTANLYVGAADGIELVQAAADEDADLLVVQEITPGLLATMESAGLDTIFPFRVGEPAEGSSATMVFSQVEPGEATRLDTKWDAWAIPIGDLTLLAVHPHAPTDVAVWRTDHHVVEHAVDQLAPDLVVGDFNATPDHPVMRDLADAGYRSVAELANEGWQPTWPANGRSDVFGIALPPTVQIDHVLVGPSYAALGSHTVEVPGSDHRAVVAEVAAK